MTLGSIEPEPVDEPIVSVELDELADWVARYRRAKELEKEVAERVKEARDMIAGFLTDRDAEFGSIGGRLAVRWRTVESHRIDTPRLRKEDPELAEKYTKVRTEHRLELIEGT